MRLGPAPVSRRWRIASMVLTLGVGAAVQCGSPAAPSRTDAVFQVRACRGSLQSPGGELFRIRLLDTTLIAQARALAGAGHSGIVAGRLVSGNGGFNAPWSWHLDPGSVSFPQVAIELCDGCPSMVEANGGTWGSGTFCPWSAEIVAEVK